MVGEAETLAAVTMGWGDRPLVAHDWKSIAAPEEPCPTPPLEHDTLVAAYLLDPAGRAYPLEELLENEGIGVAVKGADGLAQDVVGTRVLAERQRERLEELGLTRLLREVELPLVDVLIEHGAHGRQARREARRRDLRPRRGADHGARARDLGARRGGVHDRLAAAAVGDPLQQARPVEEAAREDRLLDRRARAAGDPRRAPDHREDRGLARALEAEVDLSRRAAGADRRAHRPAAHDLQPDRDDDGPAVEHEPEPPERADPDRARPRDQVVLRGRGRPQADLGRLLAGRAARARAHRGRGRAQGDLPARRGRAHGDGGDDPRHRARGRRSRARAPRPRWSTTGSSTACRPTGSPTACRSRRRRRRSSSTATSTASRRSRSSSNRRSSTRARRGTCPRCSGGYGGSPSCARASGPRARSASGWR